VNRATRVPLNSLNSNFNLSDGRPGHTGRVCFYGGNEDLNFIRWFYVMKTFRGFGLFLVFFFGLDVSGQLITADPAFPVETDSVIITFDATLGSAGLAGYTGIVYAHTGVITAESSSSGDWKHAPAWGDNSPKYEMERIGTNLYQLHIGPSIDEYYGILPGEVVKELAFVFRSSDNTREGKDIGGADIFYPVYAAGLNVTITKPEQRPLIVELGDSIFIEARAQESDTLILLHDNEVVKITTGQSITDTLIVQQYGKTWVKVIAKNDSGLVADSLFYFTKKEVPVQELPEGMEDGINYVDDTTVTLVLYAPGKEFIYVIGSFNDWELDDRYYMNVTPDGVRFWITLDSLEAGKEYLFQYLVDGSILIGDPYAEKVCDPQDKYIGESTYPGLLPYPEDKTTGIASCLQTAQSAYDWNITDFTPPPTDELIVYELLIRDFVAKHDYRTLTDTLPYFKRLGVNAIELMPVNEFEGNSSWGYNTSHYFALDKYYGPKKDLQRFIDSCHSNGIAVILDVVLNHSFGQSPMVRLYWDSQNNRPAADNPWFNPIPKHDFNVGYDLNHESEATKYLVKRILKYWLEEYRVDGYRFDLSKGFTQNNTLGDAAAMARYDAGRIAILKAYADTIWKVNPGAYVILEHFADNDEEQVLTDYGMMVWGNSQYNYGRAGMGWSFDGKSDFSWGCYKNRGFSKPHLVTYMESHDEQRQMYDIITWGNYENPNYNVRNNLEIALVRGELCAAFFFTIPGPKMIWQFGEQGNDYDIFYNNDKLAPKPIRWDYLEDPNRQRLFQVYSTFADLKRSYPVFNTTDFSIDVSDTMKTIHLRHQEMDVTILGNFDTYPQTIDPSFTRTGTWYDYLKGDSLVVSDVHMPIGLDKSEYRIYTSVKLETPDLISAPRALDVSISGSMGIGEALTGHYTYYDGNGDPEGQSKYKWFRGKYPNGADKVQILGAMETTYTIKEADWNHYLFFEVTPVAATGNLLTGIKEYGTMDLATSIDQPVEPVSRVSVYPNPAREGFHVRIEGVPGDRVILELYNMTGSLVYRSEPTSGKGAATEHDINLSGLDSGVYLLKIRTDNEQIIHRVIKL
jgi:1,4-alpha-glucan branching enzyme